MLYKSNVARSVLSLKFYDVFENIGMLELNITLTEKLVQKTKIFVQINA